MSSRFALKMKKSAPRTLILSFVFVAAGYWLLNQTGFQKPEKPLPKSTLFHHTEKLKGPLSIELKPLSKGKWIPGDPQTLVAKISTHRQIQDVKVQWRLPQEVEVLQGPTSFELAELHPGSPETFEIVVRHYADKNYQIHFSAKSQTTGLGASGQFNTKVQKEIKTHYKKIQKKVKKSL